MNQGMLMESLNLASVWRLPVLFVCKDDGWAITTQSRTMTGGDIRERVSGFGLPYVEVDGRDVGEVWEAARGAIERARSGGGPAFLHASCVHLEAHFLGYPLLRVTRSPLQEMPGMAGPMIGSFLRPRGAAPRERLAGWQEIATSVLDTRRDPRRQSSNDPLMRTRADLESGGAARLRKLEDDIKHDVAEAVSSALGESPA